MQDPLQRLYKTKIVLLAVLLVFPGLGLTIVGALLEHGNLSSILLLAIGGGIFTTGLLGVGWQYFDAKDSEARDTARLRRVLVETAPAMRDAVIEGFAFEPEDIARVATPEVLAKIVTNGLAIQLKDPEFAQEIYDDLRQQAIGIPERLHDARISVRLSMDRGSTRGRTPMFVVTVRWEFTVVPSYQTRRFTCVSDLDEFRDVTQDTVATSVWYLKAEPGVDAGAKESFELVEFAVDGNARTIRRSAKPGSQTYSVNLGKDIVEAGEPVTVAYTYRTVAPVDAHMLQLRVDQPTRGLSVELDYSDCGIDYVNVLDFIASSEKTRVSRSPQTVPGKSVSVEFDGWVFPRSGVAFVWN